MKQGVTSDRLVELVDLYPTLTELAGIPTPRHLDGTSFVPLLQDPSAPWKRAAFTEVLRQGQGNVRGRSVRTERYRYNEWGHARKKLNFMTTMSIRTNKRICAGSCLRIHACGTS